METKRKSIKLGVDVSPEFAERLNRFVNRKGRGIHGYRAFLIRSALESYLSRLEKEEMGVM